MTDRATCRCRTGGGPGWAVERHPARLTVAVASQETALLPSEWHAGRALFQAEGRTLAPEDLLHAETLPRLAARADTDWLDAALTPEALYPVFQPIVAAHDPGTLLGHECLIRGRLGSDVVPPGQLFEAARAADRLFELDRVARQRAIEGAADAGAPGRIFVNFNPTAIYDPAFCLRSTLRTIRDKGLAPERVVFEVVESDPCADVAHLRHLLDYYRNAGFQVALDDVGSGYSSLTLLNELRPDYLKLDMGLIREVDRDPYKAALAAAILAFARQVGLRTIAEGVETDAEWDWVRTHGADYVQGYRIARPAPIPATPPFAAA